MVHIKTNAWTYLTLFLNFAALLKAFKHSESLDLAILNNHLVHANFKFLSHSDPVAVSTEKFDLFPRYLGEIINKYNVQELSLHLTQGTWRNKVFGDPAANSNKPSGAEVFAVFKSGTEDVDKNWLDLVNSLSGLVCASLNFMDSSITVQPDFTMKPMGVVAKSTKFNQTLVRYSILPFENVCTENLTPWKKLLPCSFSQEGLSSLLSSRKIFDSQYHSLGITVEPTCNDKTCSSTMLELTQSLSIIFNPEISNGNDKGWELSRLFGTSVKGKCAVAEQSKINIISGNSGPSAISLDPEINSTQNERDLRVSSYDTVAGLNIKATYNGLKGRALSAQPKFYTRRFVHGWGQENGKLVTEIVNKYTDFVDVMYMELVPWYIRPFMHTLKIQTAEGQLKPTKLSYQPGSGARRARKTHLLELRLSIPANSTVTIEYDFDKMFMKWDEYPPDANLGRYLPSAVITALVPDTDSSYCIQKLTDGTCLIRLYTDKILIPMPTPDFSMPYNVLCLACTIVALGFGQLHMESVHTYKRRNDKDESKMDKLVKKIKGLFTRTPVSGEDADEKQSDQHEKIE